MRRFIATFMAVFTLQALVVAAVPDHEETLLFAVVGSHTTSYYAPSAHLRDMPLWNPMAEPPPVQLTTLTAKALAIVTAIPGMESKKWSLFEVKLSEIAAFRGRWLYHIMLAGSKPDPAPNEDRSASLRPSDVIHSVYFLHDGTQINGRVTQEK